jgi:hypothetical protein
MPLTLRVDVDKPYGNSNFINAVRSKLTEDYWYPNVTLFNRNYLSQLSSFLKHCNDENICGYFYYRRSTVPNLKIIQLMQEGGHRAGLHAENTRSFETFKSEWDTMSKACSLELGSFSKHGSGQLKLGKYHYPPYEPDKYKEWANKLGVEFRFGNGICSSVKDFEDASEFYPEMFWIERDYRDQRFSNLEEVIECAKNNLVPVLIHPSNYSANKEVKQDFKELISLAKKNNVDWVL